MDLALALWHINPAYEYTLTDDKTAIAEWRSGDPQPTDAQLQSAFADAQSTAQAAEQARLDAIAAAEAQRLQDAKNVESLFPNATPDEIASFLRLAGVST